jgi:hypothetical protein
LRALLVGASAKRIFGAVAVKAARPKGALPERALPPLMKSPWVLLAALLGGVAVALAGSLACTKSAECDPSHCAAGNQCIDDGSGSGSSCHKVCKTQADCPANWHCNDGLPSGGATSWCVENSLTYPPGTGQWGATCAAAQGEGANPACNWSQGFACYGTSPTDAKSFCTQFACQSDGECPGGWWCSTQNVGPNVTSAAPTYGKTRTICLPRTYCAPCKKDLDCYAPAGSPPAHCVPDASGASFCTTACTDDSTCAFDATCRAAWKVCTPAPAKGSSCQTDDECPPAGGVYQHCVGGACSPECSSAGDCAQGQTCARMTACIPRAGVCVGDGTFCSPCRSDDDCIPKAAMGAPQPPGYCLATPYSTERFCSAKSTVDGCDAQATDPPGCPPPQGSDNWKAVACIQSPPDQCVGVVSFGSATGSPVGLPGCWTVNR